MTNTIRPVGEYLRQWRQRRRLSQLDLALEAEISTRHLSFMETGRALPSREMVLRLAERLDIPLRERNALLLAAGYAPMFLQRKLDDPALQAVRKAMELVLAGHEPYPALAIDRHWNLVAANKALPPLLDGVDPALLQPPVNVLRLSLHPQGMAPRIANYWEWRAHLFERLRRQIDLSADPVLTELLHELSGYPAPDGLAPQASGSSQAYAGVVVPLQLASPAGTLSFISTTTLFGTPLDVTLSELALESFFPADERTAQALQRHAAL
ncbi:helix-turn-helix domain-containing protein [Noviherbaspirillum autotrophicum]|uniref:XRE family transcriptional regulator n=1 Tax=Noviherbaspirillum autotrophicum TaxID=709839 RepID=A0A0C1Y8G6_9BURK|nr:helix-turn-helix transcriptional regulator [Noviherbaspirillum autotrophicum]KIF83228.1 XRE family transcriptional regulator [Noviherbaspirillum autotrophicum]